MKNSLLISPFLYCLYLLLLVSCVSIRDTSTNSNHPLLDKEKTSRYQLFAKINQVEISGIMILKYTEGAWQGSLVNEFGVKAFDLVAPKGKCRLQNILPFLDKWYIRRTIASDLAFLFWETGQGKPGKGKSMERLPDGTLLLKNEKHHITYLFQPFEE
jgi:hypothetical protein